MNLLYVHQLQEGLQKSLKRFMMQTLNLITLRYGNRILRGRFRSVDMEVLLRRDKSKLLSTETPWYKSLVDNVTITKLFVRKHFATCFYPCK